MALFTTAIIGTILVYLAVLFTTLIITSSAPVRERMMMRLRDGWWPREDSVHE